MIPCSLFIQFRYDFLSTAETMCFPFFLPDINTAQPGSLLQFPASSVHCSFSDISLAASVTMEEYSNSLLMEI